MIKIGQIYEELSGIKWLITRIDPTLDGVIVQIISDKGCVKYGYYVAAFFEERRLIAEYPTWQEAVNSKEFKND